MIDSGREDWISYFMSMAHLVAKRSTCLRRQVGAVAVINNRIIATGYNGAPSRLKHCAEIGCQREILNIPSGQRHELCRAIHAEQNVIIQAATSGSNMYGAIIFCTHQPCVICAKMLANCGVSQIYIANRYPDKDAERVLCDSNIRITMV